MARMGIGEVDGNRTQGRILLIQHIEKHWNGNQSAFSSAIGIPRLTINRYVKGRLLPNLWNAAKIEKFTGNLGNQVKCIDWTIEISK